MPSYRLSPAMWVVLDNLAAGRQPDHGFERGSRPRRVYLALLERGLITRDANGRPVLTPAGHALYPQE